MLEHSQRDNEEGAMATASLEVQGVLISEDAAWRAVLARDRSQDGRFVYAVRTTGVYCRPSCPSRRPRRENVSFHATPDEAELAGYRACRRCRPRSLAGTATERAVRRALDFIDAHLDERVTLERLGGEVGVSAFHLQRTFRDRVGLSPRAYQDARRLERLKGRLQRGDTVGRVTFEAGFGSARGAYAGAAAGLGMTPGAYRRGGRGLEVRYTVLAAPLGRVLVGATSRGVCAVALGDDDAGLEAELLREFPAAALVRDDAALREWVAPIVAYLETGHPGLALPVELHGTAFQLRVWNALREIPAGETRSYGEVAAAIGRPGAARAVARACAGNRTALVVPCHRVVPAAGGVGGYRWGEERKRALLEREKEGQG
jgi:AraC family transcriptional regulator of adaptative response/methylated-DNA-[protein]-cysteine methyltransferase